MNPLPPCYQPWIWPGRTPYCADDFGKMSLADAQSFLKEFKRRVPERMTELQRAIGATSPFSNWQPDLTGKSLVDVGRWLLDVVHRRPLGDSEATFVGGVACDPPQPGSFAEEIRSRIRVFTDDSWSPLVDASIYFCECVRSTSPRWTWKRCWLKGATISNQPVLVLDRFGGTEIPPFEIGRNLTRNILDDRVPPELWADMYSRKIRLPAQNP